ncbi:hypothetical protein QVD17_15230 [Tagetes erecta]|uniref:Uncharacterized protein n=1 Tax=Tagetes erecta TaxID=13708 RepID=A0AAD8NSF6_TARER|nr:hypothetical protein QVD17_15230 [Tagetes erecta]
MLLTVASPEKSRRRSVTSLKDEHSQSQSELNAARTKVKEYKGIVLLALFYCATDEDMYMYICIDRTEKMKKKSYTGVPNPYALASPLLLANHLSSKALPKGIEMDAYGENAIIYRIALTQEMNKDNINVDMVENKICVFSGGDINYSIPLPTGIKKAVVKIEVKVYEGVVLVMLMIE